MALTDGLPVFHLHPKLHPTMWKQFVAGAVERYSEYGYEDILDEELRSGRTTDAFTFMLHGDTPVGGVRTRMVRSIGESASLKQFEGHPLYSRLCAEVSEYLDEGIAEGMTLWADRSAPPTAGRSTGISQLATARAIGARWTLGTVQQRFVNMWLETGAEILDHGIPARWPTPDILTRLVRWDLYHRTRRSLRCSKRAPVSRQTMRCTHARWSTRALRTEFGS